MEVEVVILMVELEFASQTMMLLRRDLDGENFDVDRRVLGVGLNIGIANQEELQFVPVWRTI